MIPGDHLATAEGITQRLGISQDRENVITGLELDNCIYETATLSVRTTRRFLVTLLR